MGSRLTLLTVSIVLALTAIARGQLADAQSRREALGFLRAGQELMAAERFDRAAESFLKAIEKDGLLSLAHYQLGQAYMNLRRYTDAVKAYQDSIEAMRTLHGMQQGNQVEVQRRREDEIRELRVALDRVKVGALRTAHMEQHLNDLERLRTTPIDGPFQVPSEVLLALGSAHFRNGDLEAAETQWKFSIAANPKYGEAHNNLAAVYMETGRIDLAIEELALAEKAGFRVNPQFKEDLKKRKAGR